MSYRVSWRGLYVVRVTWEWVSRFSPKFISVGRNPSSTCKAGYVGSDPQIVSALSLNTLWFNEIHIDRWTSCVPVLTVTMHMCRFRPLATWFQSGLDGQLSPAIYLLYAATGFFSFLGEIGIYSRYAATSWSKCSLQFPLLLRHQSEVGTSLSNVNRAIARTFTEKAISPLYI